MSKIVNYHVEDLGDGLLRRTPIVRCGCGSSVECWDSWANQCDSCGTEYNGSGQQLADRYFWGEETGETF